MMCGGALQCCVCQNNIKKSHDNIKKKHTPYSYYYYLLQLQATTSYYIVEVANTNV